MGIVSKKLRSDKRLKWFGVCQGACYHKGKMYIAYERGKNKKNHAIKIARYDFKTLKLEKVSKAMQLGHANGITVKGNTIYVTHSGGDRILHRVDAKTLKKKSDKHISIPAKLKKHGSGFSGVAYDETTGRFYLRLIGTKNILVLDKDLKYKSTFKVEKHWMIANDMDAHNKLLYRTYSQKQDADKGRVAIFDYKGKCLKTWKPNIGAEMEACFMVGNTLYLTYYRRKRVNGKLKKYCWLVKA